MEIARCSESLFSKGECKKGIASRILEYNVHAPRIGLSRDIVSNMSEIKAKGLEYWDAFVTGRFQVNKVYNA